MASNGSNAAAVAASLETRTSAPLRSHTPAENEDVPFVGESKPNEDTVEQEMEAAYVNADQQRLLHAVSNASAASEGSGKGGKGAEHVHHGRSLLRDALNISHVLTDGAAAIVDDSFLKCFATRPADPWNWNAYLWPQWALGVIIRHFILFPLRLACLIIGNSIFFILFFGAAVFMREGPQKKDWMLKLVQFLCGSFMLSWNAVVRYHGPKPTPGPGKVWVSNHSSMIDYPILCSHSPFSVIMQLQTGWVAFLQTRVLNSLGCLWFNRTDLKDRHIVAERMRAHVFNPKSVPLLIFPEGTCVNNEYCVLFKRGAFDMGATVCPVAIKYNKIFVDAFWNSKKETFGHHLMRLMMSWGLVCDVWFLEPQTLQPGETPDQFASRVQKMIADTAGLKVVPWDGYLKYYNLGQAKPALVEARRKVIGDVLRQYLPGGGYPSRSGSTPRSAAPAEAEASEPGQKGKKNL